MPASYARSRLLGFALMAVGLGPGGLGHARVGAAREREVDDGEYPVAVLPAQGKVSVLAEPGCYEGCAGLSVYELRDGALIQVADAKGLRCED